jgi:hypothetical protein
MESVAVGESVSLINGHIESSKKGMQCDKCAYYDTDRTDQPCCNCVGGCNFESEE